jgi:hypothetical protein
MAKVYYPLFSGDVRGRLGKRVIYRRGGVVTRYFVPRDPKSAAQLAQRVFFLEHFVGSLTQEEADLLYAAIAHLHDDRYSLLAHGHDHGGLSGLSDDDHSQYYNQARGDARYRYLDGDELSIKQRRDNGFTLSDGFDSGSLPVGYGWAGAPFATPTVDLASAPSMMVLSSSGVMRSYLYTSSIPSTSIIPLVNVGWMLGASTGYAGLRMDDGTDNNYFEWLLSGDLKGTVRTRVAGGAVATVQGAAMPLPQMYGVRANRTGTKYTAWGANIFFVMPWQGVLIQGLQTTSATTNATWTPARFGFVFHVQAVNVAVFDGLYL